jgi:hypothetical protein
MWGWLDHGSAYYEDAFPCALLIDDTSLEPGELTVEYLSTKANGQTSAVASLGAQKSFGLTTFSVEIPYERDTSAAGVAKGFATVEWRARRPIYQLLSGDGFCDATFGLALEGGLPTHSALSENGEIGPQVFNATKVGKHLRLQTVLGYSSSLGSGAEGGLRTFDYGANFAWSIDEKEFSLPGVEVFAPMFELIGERGLNRPDAARSNLSGDVGFRLGLKPLLKEESEFGLAYVFPIRNGARSEGPRGIFLSLHFAL